MMVSPQALESSVNFLIIVRRINNKNKKQHHQTPSTRSLESTQNVVKMPNLVDYLTNHNNKKVVTKGTVNILQLYI